MKRKMSFFCASALALGTGCIAADESQTENGSLEISLTTPLDLPTGSFHRTYVGAYGLRKLRDRYNGAAIRVVNASGSAADIGFDDGELDAAALNAHLNGGTGFVSTWYNQSANSSNQHATAPEGKRPKIVFRNSIGRYVLNFDGIDDSFEDARTRGSNSMAVLACFSPASGGAGPLFSFDDTAKPVGLFPRQSNGTLLVGNGVDFESHAGQFSANQFAVATSSYGLAGNKFSLGRNGVELFQADHTRKFGTDRLNIGIENGGGETFKGDIAEFFVAGNPLVADRYKRAEVETNMMQYCGILELPEGPSTPAPGPAPGPAPAPGPVCSNSQGGDSTVGRIVRMQVDGSGAFAVTVAGSTAPRPISFGQSSVSGGDTGTVGTFTSFSTTSNRLTVTHGGGSRTFTFEGITFGNASGGFDEINRLQVIPRSSSNPGRLVVSGVTNGNNGSAAGNILCN